MSNINIAILTLDEDLHGLAIKKRLDDNYPARCHMIAVDKLAMSTGLTWSNVGSFVPTLRTTTGEYIDIRNLDAIWYRRFGKMQALPSTITNPAHVELINNDCEASLLGLLLNEFFGVWISHPDATRVASNKLLQLRVAREAGFRVPQTLVSQDPPQIRRFCTMLNNQVIVKDVRGWWQLGTSTTMVQQELLQSDEILGLTPAIYQECIKGRHHIRAQCFGDEVYAALIETDALDWRYDLNIPISQIDLDNGLKAMIKKALSLLGLRMGIFDLKLTEDGEPVWLEVNPQGQFLFIEGLCALPLTEAMSDFLYREAERGRKMRTSQAVQRTLGAVDAVPLWPHGLSVDFDQYCLGEADDG